MKPNYQSYTEDELLDALNHIDKNAWPERYAEIKKHLQKYADKAKENGVSNASNSEASESSWWRKVDFNKPQEKVITLGLTLWTLYILFAGEISAKNSDISFEESPKTYVLFVVFFMAILGWRIYGHLTSHNKRLNSDND
ncbi:hypothetical protein [Thalassotalea piscium]|uniref:Uncharacterized protein n=1 Tax=Thalassotalea piscium TaxID=1230533 RepID=A0A7X0NKL6_9GAMM|nr:hypothetical protein [Thalassotalea piscium]MBB6545163.1 hypothetical protein [Thalassotalea piscium]